MSTLKFEVGKAYMTRDGRKAVCLTTTLKGDYEIGLQVEGIFQTVTLEGRYNQNPTRESGLDIVSEWREKPIVDWDAMPKWANFVAMYSHGDWCWFGEKPTIFNNGWQPKGLYYDEIPSEYAPKFDGDWKKSLIERP